MTKVSVELEIEQIETIVIHELQRHYDNLNHDVGRMLEQEAAGTLPAWKVTDLRNNTRTLNAIQGVLEFYMNDTDFTAWLASYDFPSDDEDDVEADTDTPVVSVTDVVEHEDGSATYTFDMRPDAVSTFAKIGLRAALIEAAEKGCQDGNDDVDEAHD